MLGCVRFWLLLGTSSLSFSEFTLADHQTPASFATAQFLKSNESSDEGASLDLSTDRRLNLATFSGFSLSSYLGWNVPSYSQESSQLQDLRAGVPYPRLTLLATSGLGANISRAFVKLVWSNSSSDAHCAPGSDYEAPHIVSSFSPTTCLDGRTSAINPISIFENSWLLSRFPYGGTFKVCYFGGSTWNIVNAEFIVNGASSNLQKFWCVAGVITECRFATETIGGLTSWTVTLVAYAGICGEAINLTQAFQRTLSATTEDPDHPSRFFHSLGPKADDIRDTYKVCYCPGFTASLPANPCAQPADFVQLAGLLYATRVISPQTIYSVLSFDVLLQCGSTTAGGCPLSDAMRYKLVEPAQQNDAASYSITSGCRSAPQSVLHFYPSNCAGPTSCVHAPDVLSESDPYWAGVRLLVGVENHAPKVKQLDVCFCVDACSQPESWFKVDRIKTSVIRVLPNPLIANRPSTLQLLGPNGGWISHGDAESRALKVLFDPEGTVTKDDCFATPQDTRSVFGYFCYTLTACQPPTLSSSDGHQWNDVGVRFAGMYSICYCDVNCGQPEFWNFLSWHLVAGPYSEHAWFFSRGVSFDVLVTGWGLHQGNRLLAIATGGTCGSAPPESGVQLPASVPSQLGDLSGDGVLSLSFVYDGTLMVTRQPHGLDLEDYVTLTDVSSSDCQYCLDVVLGRPHKVIRIISPTQLVLPIMYPEREYPTFNVSGVGWKLSSEVTFRNLLGLSAGIYTICWGSDEPVIPSDFVSTVGTLDVFEPPVFQAKIYTTASQDGVLAPIVIAFQPRNDARYKTTVDEMQFQVVFQDLLRLSPGVSPSAAEAPASAPWSAARQSVCGEIFRELWSSDPDGFPMPKGCFYMGVGTGRMTYSFLFSARNGLKGDTSYQIVMDANFRLAVAPAPLDGVVQLWSLDGVNTNPFGVLEYAPVWPDKVALVSTSLTTPQFSPSDGLSIVSDGASELELIIGTLGRLPLRVAARSGTSISAGALVRIFLWPLTQWDLGASCLATCTAQVAAYGESTRSMRCDDPACVPSVVVTDAGPGQTTNIAELTFSEMDPITDVVRHTVVLERLSAPAGGFFANHVAAELQSSDRIHPSYTMSSGALLFALPTAVGSVLGGVGSDRPFRGDQGNTIYARIVFGASLWSSSTGDAGFEITLPMGYVCVNAAPADVDLPYFEGRAPQGRGEVGLDAITDGYWLFSMGACTYVLRTHSAIYAGSSIFIKLTVNNPVVALPRSSAVNVFSVRARGKGAPLIAESTIGKLGLVSYFVDLDDEYLQKNVPVLGSLTSVSLAPDIFGAGQDRNWLSVFFTTEQGSQGPGGRLILRVPQGFGFFSQCDVNPLPSYHYAILSNQRAGVAGPTILPEVVRCNAQYNSVSQSFDAATLYLSTFMILKELTAYGFKIQVYNAPFYETSQRLGFKLLTATAEGDMLDGIDAMPLLAGDSYSAGLSFGVYWYPMAPGTFVVGLSNMLPYSEIGITARVVIFPLRVPFSSLSAVDWRIVAPYGYEWDFHDSEFFYRVEDILGATATLPVDHAPSPPYLPPKNILEFLGNFRGVWDERQVYGVIARIRVPDATPTSSDNSFYVEFGYTSEDFNSRLAAASYEAPRVRALQNLVVDFQDTTLTGQQNRILIQVEMVSNLAKDGGLVIEAPQGFVFEQRCVVLASPSREEPYKDLSVAAGIVCESQVPYTTNRPLVTLSVVTGDIVAAAYEFMLDAQNPPTAMTASSATWTISSYRALGLSDPADVQASLQGFPIEMAMFSGELLDNVDRAATSRDDHPSQYTFIVLSFSFKSPNQLRDSSVLTVKAPFGFEFPKLCEVIVDDNVFGENWHFPPSYVKFDVQATVTSCSGLRNTARISVTSGLLNLQKYAFRLGVFNPPATPDHNTWTISYLGESTVPINGYRLWAFTEVSVVSLYAARSTPIEKTNNAVTIFFRPTNPILSTGLLSILAPFGFEIPTDCFAVFTQLNPSGTPLAIVPFTKCSGAQEPTNAADLQFTDVTGMIFALEPYKLDVVVVNPTTLSVDPGAWMLQSYSSLDKSHGSLLDVGNALSFTLTEVFDTLVVIYPPYLSTFNALFFGIEFRIVLLQAIELGDIVELNGPDGYDFATASSLFQDQVGFHSCRGFVGKSPESLPGAQCLDNSIRLAFVESGLPLQATDEKTPLISFVVETAYPSRTLTSKQNVFLGRHLRGLSVLSSKAVSGQLWTPRLQGLVVERLDEMVAIGSFSSLQMSFSPSQQADVLEISSISLISQVFGLNFNLSVASVQVQVDSVPIQTSVAVQTNSSMLLELQMLEGVTYTLIFSNVINPILTGRGLWSFSTFQRPQSGNIGPVMTWALDSNLRDQVQGFVGPATVGRIILSPQFTTLATPYFDIVNVELYISFMVYPDAVPAGQFVIFRAPLAYEFVDRTFKPGEGFPIVSGTVFVQPPHGAEMVRWSYVIQILTSIRAQQDIRFTVRVNTPNTPSDLTEWETRISPAWLIITSQDVAGTLPSASNDYLFPGFKLLSSFGAVALTPEPGGITPLKLVTVTLSISPKATLQSVLEGGSVTVRVTAPLGFDFPAGCLAATPNPIFEQCNGFGRKAVLVVRRASLPSGLSVVVLATMNPGMTPTENLWQLDGFIDVDPIATRDSLDVGQRSIVRGYEIRQLIAANIGSGNTQRESVTVVDVWFLATYFIDFGGGLELHAPAGYSLRCQPQVQYISLPPCSCQLNSGVVASHGDQRHDFVSLTLAVLGQEVYPNKAYAFGVPATNPPFDVTPNYWGLVLFNGRGERLDATMTIDGYKLTDYNVIVESLLPSNMLPSVVNHVRLTLVLQRDLEAGLVGRIAIIGPSTYKVLCSQFLDMSGGGDTLEMLPLVKIPNARYGDHDCVSQNSIMLFINPVKVIQAGTYVLDVPVLNPGLNAVQDYWSVELWQTLATGVGVTSTGTETTSTNASVLLSVKVIGFGVSDAFAGAQLPAYNSASLAGRGHDAGMLFAQQVLTIILMLLTTL